MSNHIIKRTINVMCHMCRAEQLNFVDDPDVTNSTEARAAALAAGWEEHTENGIDLLVGPRCLEMYGPDGMYDDLALRVTKYTEQLSEMGYTDP